nr:MAG TPA: hypothetical protein [Caudoviricetes sp.]
MTEFYKTIPSFTKPCPSFTSLRFLFNMQSRKDVFWR